MYTSLQKSIKFVRHGCLFLNPCCKSLMIEVEEEEEEEEEKKKEEEEKEEEEKKEGGRKWMKR